MNIDWNALGEVAGVSIGTTVAVVVVFACGVRALAPDRTGGEADPAGEGPRATAAPVGRAVAGLCFLACLSAVAYGLYLIIPQFH